MTEVKPASDSEIAEWLESILGDRPEDGELAGVRWMEEDEWAYRLVHRIESDRAALERETARADKGWMERGKLESTIAKITAALARAAEHDKEQSHD